MAEPSAKLVGEAGRLHGVAARIRDRERVDREPFVRRDAQRGVGVGEPVDRGAGDLREAGVAQCTQRRRKWRREQRQVGEVEGRDRRGDRDEIPHGRQGFVERRGGQRDSPLAGVRGVVTVGLLRGIADAHERHLVAVTRTCGLLTEEPQRDEVGRREQFPCVLVGQALAGDDPIGNRSQHLASLSFRYAQLCAMRSTIWVARASARRPSAPVTRGRPPVRTASTKSCSSRRSGSSFCTSSLPPSIRGRPSSPATRR